MESESFHITKDHVSPDAAPGAMPYRAPSVVREHRSMRAAESRLQDEALHLRLEEPVRVRLGLQRHAPSNLRRHLRRHVTRVVALIVADLSAFWLMRELIRAVRDQAALGEWIAQPLQRLLPAGYLNGWQFAAALLLGLFVTGSYGEGDRRHDPTRLFAACALAAALPLWSRLWLRGPEVVLVEYALTATLVWLILLAERAVLDVVSRAPYGGEGAS